MIFFEVGFTVLTIMDSESLKKLLADTRRQEEELRKDREALERVARLLNIPSPSQSPIERDLLTVRARSFSDAIREAIAAQKGEFTVQEIFHYLEKNYPDMNPAERRTSISSLMGSFAGKHMKRIRSGKGVPTVYEKL